MNSRISLHGNPTFYNRRSWEGPGYVYMLSTYKALRLLRCRRVSSYPSDPSSRCDLSPLPPGTPIPPIPDPGDTGLPFLLGRPSARPGSMTPPLRVRPSRRGAIARSIWRDIGIAFDNRRGSLPPGVIPRRACREGPSSGAPWLRECVRNIRKKMRSRLNFANIANFADRLTSERRERTGTSMHA
jgi:hypothetical protein